MEQWDWDHTHDGVSLNEFWRTRVEMAAARYYRAKESPNGELEGATEEYARVLGIYADLVLRGVKPES